MQFLSSVLLGLGLVASTQARPSSQPPIPVVELTFHGGPASYQLAVPEDETVIPTNNGISVDTIDSPNFDAYNLCVFNTAGKATFTSSVNPQGVQQITVGPPQPILSVACSA
ncbi:hypothetical protein F4861DRAFT_495057 [Xylaria intraflava]|nr:hypothetical protein F4861DRAFT_495057 [Xylaria intraflava]